MWLCRVCFILWSMNKELVICGLWEHCGHKLKATFDHVSFCTHSCSGNAWIKITGNKVMVVSKASYQNSLICFSVLCPWWNRVHLGLWLLSRLFCYSTIQVWTHCFRGGLHIFFYLFHYWLLTKCLLVLPNFWVLDSLLTVLNTNFCNKSSRFSPCSSFVESDSRDPSLNRHFVDLFSCFCRFVETHVHILGLPILLFIED